MISTPKLRELADLSCGENFQEHSISTPKLRELCDMTFDNNFDKENNLSNNTPGRQELFSNTPESKSKIRILEDTVRQLKEQVIDGENKKLRQLAELRLQHQTNLSKLQASSRQGAIDTVRDSSIRLQEQHEIHVGELNQRHSEKYRKIQNEMRTKNERELEALQDSVSSLSAYMMKCEMLQEDLQIARSQILSLKLRHDNNPDDRTLQEINQKKQNDIVDIRISNTEKVFLGILLAAMLSILFELFN